MSAVLTVSQIIERFGDAMTTGKFIRSRWAFALFGQDTDQLMPRAFAVGVGASVIEDFDGRERYGDQGEARTTVFVRVASRLRGDAQVPDYREALDHEHDAVKAALDLDSSLFHTTVVRIDRAVTASGEWMISTIEFVAYHRYSFVRGL